MFFSVPRSKRYIFFPTFLFQVLTLNQTYAEAAGERFNYFDLPRQSLQTSVIELALQADITIIANHELLKDYQSPPIIGPFTTEQALARLLTRAPLLHAYSPEADAYIILPAPPTVDAPAASEPATEVDNRLQEVVVYSPRYPFRYNTLTNTQLQNGLPVYDSSRFHTVLPRELVEDQLPLDLADLLKYGSGITPGDGLADTNDDYYIRGFPRHAVYVDGFRVEKTTGAKFLPDNIDRVEILKGPSTVRYGQGEPGGVVNVVRKKPAADSHRNVAFSAGTAARNKFSVDINDALLIENMRYRLNYVGFWQGEAGDTSDLQRQLIAPAISWDLNRNTFLDLSYEYQFVEQTANKDFPVFLPLADENFPGATLADLIRQAKPEFTADFHLLQADATHYFADASTDSEWQLNARFFWQEEVRDGVRTNAEQLKYSDLFFDLAEVGLDYIVLIPGSQVAIPIIYRANLNDPYDPIFSIGTVRNLYDEESSETGLYTLVGLEGMQILMGLTHHISTGVDWRRQDLFQSFTVESRRPFGFQSWTESDSPPFSYFYNVLFDPNRSLGSLSTREQRRVHDEYGLYLQDTVEVSERLNITIGTRYTQTTAEHENLTESSTSTLEDIQKFRSQVGYAYKLYENLTLFGSYSEGLRANYTTGDLDAVSDKPELSEQWEGGAKSQFLDGRLFAAIAFYSIDKSHIFELDANLTSTYELAEMGQFVRGVDLDFTYQLSARTNIMGSLSALDPVISYGKYKDNIPAAAAQDTASAFIHHNTNEHLSLTAGAHYVGKRYADNANQFQIGSFYTFDVGAQYQFSLNNRSVKLQINVKNLLDRDYYSVVLAGVRQNKAEGRQIFGTFSVEL